MAGWLTVDSHGLETEEDLADWVQTSLDFARTLPAK